MASQNQTSQMQTSEYRQVQLKTKADRHGTWLYEFQFDFVIKFNRNIYFIVQRDLTFTSDEKDNNEQDGNEFLATENPYYDHTGELGLNSIITSSNIVNLEDTEVVTATQNIYYAELW